MNVEEILTRFTLPEGLPVGAIRASLSDRDEVVPAFVDLLRRSADDAAGLDEEDALFIVIHVLGETGDQRAFQPLLDFIAGDQERVERILGDAITENLSQILIATFDGAAGRLYDIMNDPEIDEFVRDAVFHAWTYFVLTGRIDRTEAHAYLRDCFETLRPARDSYIWVALIDAVARLGFEDLRELVKAALEDRRVPERALVFGEFEDALLSALEASGSRDWMESERLCPFRDTIGVLSRWHCFSEEYVRQRRQDQIAFLSEDTVLNPYRHVGRNDPCPCGSGKKFKKCCLH